MKNSTDVIVIGLGAMGSAAAQHLAERGYSVQGFDLFNPPHAHGSSHGLTRIFRQAYFEDYRYVPLLVRSFELWKKLEADTGRDLLHLPGALVIGSRGGQLVERSADSAARFSLPHEVLDAAELKRRYPVFTAHPDTYALLEKNAGYLRAEICVGAQLTQALRAGAHLHTNEPVLDWQVHPDQSSVSVRTTQGTYSAGHLVVTAGPWAPQLLAKLALPLRVTRQVLYWFQPKCELARFHEDRLPVYLIEGGADQRLVYGFPLTGDASEGVKVALHGSEETCTADSVSHEITPADELSIRERLADTLPDLSGRLLRAETCLYTMTPDEHFIVDAHPYSDLVTIAAGFSGHGFKFAPVIGEILADLVTGRNPLSAPALFSASRFQAIGNHLTD